VSLSRTGADVVLAGVGGQGTVLASAVLADVALHAGFDVKRSEVHGMSQRGGGVVSHVRFRSGRVHAPTVAVGEADLLVAFEQLEALRCLRHIRHGGVVVASTTRIQPITVSAGKAVYPGEDALERAVEKAGCALVLVHADELARHVGNLKTANVVVLGAASTHLPLPDDAWFPGIERRVPRRLLDVNRSAFETGRLAAERLRRTSDEAAR